MTATRGRRAGTTTAVLRTRGAGVTRAHGGDQAGCLPHHPHRAAGASAGILGPNLPQAACKGATEPLWDFSVDGELPGQRAQRLEWGTAICRTCPERAACRSARLNNPDLGAGLYGGVLFGHDSASETRKCRCGKTLPSSRHTREYCSAACRQVACRERAGRGRAA